MENAMTTHTASGAVARPSTYDPYARLWRAGGRE